MEASHSVRSFWREFLRSTERPSDTPLLDVFHFSDGEEDATEFADLVLHGKKVATASLLWEYEREEARPPEEGDLSIVTSWDGRPLCVIQTMSVSIRAFDDVDAEFAAAEGEGDLSLESWRKGHWAYFGRVCRQLGRESSSRMPVVCERFKLVFVGASEHLSLRQAANDFGVRWRQYAHDADGSR